MSASHPGQGAPDRRDRFRGCLLGLATGDAVGTAVEFAPRGSFSPLADMVGGGPFALEPGQWTDDTSMALCLGASLAERGTFDPADQMRRYLRWRDDGYMSSNGRCFDIGSTVAAALRRFEATGDPYSGSTAPHSAGNGCIMRLAPVPMFYWPDRDAAVVRAGDSARTTHGATECVDASRLFGLMLFRALDGQAATEILFAPADLGLLAPRIAALAAGAYRDKQPDAIRGAGYVVDCLEAALWCFWTTDSFPAAVLKAANLGEDADTTAAVCGQIAGAYYGAEAIPPAWRQRLAGYEEIGMLADSLLAHPGRSRPEGATS